MQTESQITIRTLHERDLPAIRRLAQRDSAAAPSLPLLGALQDGRLIAAADLRGSATSIIADPFSATAGSVSLLRMRAAQLWGGSRGRSRGRLRLPSLGRRSRGAIAGSPPGAAGQLLRL